MATYAQAQRFYNLDSETKTDREAGRAISSKSAGKSLKWTATMTDPHQNSRKEKVLKRTTTSSSTGSDVSRSSGRTSASSSSGGRKARQDLRRHRHAKRDRRRKAKKEKKEKKEKKVKTKSKETDKGEEDDESAKARAIRKIKVECGRMNASLSTCAGLLESALKDPSFQHRKEKCISKLKDAPFTFPAHLKYYSDYRSRTAFRTEGTNCNI